MFTISGGGVFSRTNIDQINSNFGELSGGGGSGGSIDVYVNSQSGSNARDGLTPATAKATIAGCASLMTPGLRIGIRGVLFEEYSTPNIANVSLIGLGNQPLQGTTGGAPNGGGTTWMSPSGGTGTLLTLNGQGWSIENIFFNNSATGATTSCVKVATVDDPPTQPDGSHARFLNCIMTGGNFGIYSPDGANYVTIAGCTFYNFVDTGDTAIKAAQNIRTLLGWKIVNNVFYNNVNHVVAALSLGTVTGNNFIVVGNSITTTIACSLTGGAGNSVYFNAFNRPLNTSPNATLYVGGTGDVWGANVGSDNFFFGVPDNS